jgi:hypothetical protein
MKKIICVFVLFALLNSCSKQDFSDAAHSIQNADRLFMKANEGLKTLDSISKNINDSNGIAQKIIIPEIKKQTQRIDSTFKSGNFKMDSINKDIAEITKRVKTGTEVGKTLDSASQLLKEGEHPISVLTKTADQLLKRTESQKTTAPPEIKKEEVKEEQSNSVFTPRKAEQNPLIKSAKFEIIVDDLREARSVLNQKIQENNAALVSGNYNQNEQMNSEFFSIKVPLQNFNNLSRTIANDLGEVRIKNTNSEGNDYYSDQTCAIEVTLTQNQKMAPIALEEKQLNSDEKTFASKSTTALKSGFQTLQNIFLFLLPFWPFFFLGLGIFYFVRKNKLKKEQNPIDQNASPLIKENEEVPEIQSPEKTEETDYSKYLPKE